MATTDFGALLTDQKIAWARDLWRQARNASFVLKHASTSPTSCIQKVTALTKSEKGDAAVVTLVPELTGHGIAGDNTLEGNEEGASAYDFKVPIDQHRMGMKSSGRMAEQATIVKFRKTARDLLGYRFGTVIDKIGFNLLAGIAVDTNPDGVEPQWSATTGANLYELAFGTEAAPSSNRQFHTEASDAIVLGDGYGATPTAISYGHIVNLKAEAHERYIKPVVHSQYGEVYYFWVSPRVMANLKLDQDFLDNVRHAMPRSKSHDLFVGTDAVMVDGVVVMSHRYVPSNTGVADDTAITTASTSAAGVGLAKFGPTPGTTNAVTGSRCLFLGAQALALCDLGTPYWDESSDNDYGNQPGMSVGKLYGMAKTVYKGSYDDPSNAQDFGCLTLDVAHI